MDSSWKGIKNFFCVEYDKEYFIKKLDLSHSQYEEVMNSKPKLHSEYKSYSKLYDFLKENKNMFNIVKKYLNKI